MKTPSITILGLILALILVLFGCAPPPPPTAEAPTSIPPTVTPFPTFPTWTPSPTLTASPTLRPSSTPLPTNTFAPSLTPIPTFTFTPAVVNVGGDELPVRDDFSDPNSGWVEGSACEGSYGYDTANATYRMTNNLNYCPLCVSLGKSHSDVVLQVTVNKNGGADDAFFGVTCRKSGPNYFAFMINGNQEYIIKRVVGGEEVIDAFGTSGAIRGGNSSNRITATCNGDVYSLQVNGVEVASVVDPYITFGFYLGMILQTQAGIPADVSYDNFSATAP
ncbi:MAG: hypothetical protein Fur0022_44060 [Anaerolineales bacterium]